ncbi:hypothetical protein IGI04_038084 [Brassica rapa subsp. trilocularis]|uniref:Uncharacterized protein n=1 Tax=Brassica rapa subsp. trilocularis TaxID=1813537 RepID=A0ABQ7LJ77_BRACM|nr:hypothetical protein IGI04_038084 [Brassica rapa subsp. trilocularis]
MNQFLGADDFILRHHQQLAELSDDQRLVLRVDPLLFVQECSETGRGADELNRIGLRFDPIVGDLQEGRVHLHEALGFEVEAEPLAALLEVPEGDGLAWLVKHFFDDASAEIVALVPLDGFVQLRVLLPHHFQARYPSQFVRKWL